MGGVGNGRADLAGLPDVALDQGDVLLLDGAVAELLAQRLIRCCGARGDQDARGLGVEPVYEPWFERALADGGELGEARQQEVGHRFRFVRPQGVRRHAGRLVHGY